MANELLTELNAFRVDDGKAPFADWRKARHMPMLEEYRAKRAAFDAAYVTGGKSALSKADEFEASADELAAQHGRESADIARDEQLVHPEVAKRQRSAKGGAAAAKKRREATTKGQDEGTAIAKKAAEKGLSYKQLPRLAKSEIEKPLNVIHSFLDANPTLKRKEAVTALVNMGINFYTARTQYQKWYSKKAAK